MTADASSAPVPESSAPPVPELFLRLFGPFEARLNGQPLPRLRSRKEQHLLCLLALRAPRPADRLWLAGTLWPDSLEEAALFNLRRSLHFVRAALGKEHGPRLHSPTSATLALNLDGTDVDVQIFDAALKTGTPDALEAALALCSRPLLEDCTEDWAITERAARQEALLAACETCGTYCAAAGDHARAARLLRRALTLDPLRETTVRLLMHNLAQSGDTAGAMDTFRRFRRRLRRELDAAPAPETRALLGHITDVLSPVPALSVRLPRPLTPLIGRRQEVRDTVAALDTSRLVTLTGTGGVGKTRLAIAVAEDVAEEAVVCFVPLAALTQTALTYAAPLAAAVARALDIAVPCDTTDALVGHLRERSILLVLDNCEHIIDACAAFAATLLEGCGRLRVLATSRQALGLLGEVVRPVPLLSVPPGSDASRPEAEYESVQLFVARARAARSSFSADARTLPAIARVCRRLDGLPLAIELAAARVRSLSCEQIADKLDDRFSLLASGNRGALARHQTLRAAVDWSYDLLTEGERVLLGRLSVFAGGWTLEAAEAVCADGSLDVSDALPGLVDVPEALPGLVDKSLVQMQEAPDGTVRYFLLETLREYGQEKLDKAGQADTLRIRHRDWFLALAEAAEPYMSGPEQAAWLSRLETEHDNLRASLSWCEQTSEQRWESAVMGLRLAGVLGHFWLMRGHNSEGLQWLRRAMENAQKQHRPVEPASQAEGQTAKARAKALNASANLALEHDYALARTQFEESLSIYRQIEDPRGIANVLGDMGMVARDQGNFAEAQDLFTESLTLQHRLANPAGEAMALMNLGQLARSQGDYAAARTFLEEGLAIKRRLGEQQGIAFFLLSLGNVSNNQGDYALARTRYEESLIIFRQLGNPASTAHALAMLGSIAAQQGDLIEARALLEESLSTSRRLGNRRNMAYTLQLLGQTAYDQGDYAEVQTYHEESLTLFRLLGEWEGMTSGLESIAQLAHGQNRLSREAQLSGAASALREGAGNPLPLRNQQKINERLVSTRAALGDAAFTEVWETGRTMTLEQAVEYALQDAPSPAPFPVPT